MKNKKVTINVEAKEYLLNYLENWLDEFSKHSFSYRKGIVQAIYNKIDSIEVECLK
jgi:hypothetical protein